MLLRRLQRQPTAAAATAAAAFRCSHRPLSTWDSTSTLLEREAELLQPLARAASREHSVRQRKIAQAVEQQLRLLVQHPADMIAGRGRDGRGATSSATVALDAIALQGVEINGDLSVATVWWRLKAEERLLATTTAPSTEPLSLDTSADGMADASSLAADDLDAERLAASTAIKSSASWMRRRIGAALSLRKVPALKFKHVDVATGQEKTGVSSSSKRRGRRQRNASKPGGQPKQRRRRTEHLDAAFAAIASERNHSPS